MTADEMIISANRLLQQSTNSSARKRFTDVAILDAINEGIKIACLLGKVCQQISTITLSSGTDYYAYPSADVDFEDTGDTITVNCIEPFDVRYSGDSLTKMNPKHVGKQWYSSTTPLWWYTFGDFIWIHPTPGATEANQTCTVLFFGAPEEDMVRTVGDGGDDIYNIPSYIPSKYHRYLVNFAVFRGKQVYRLFAEGDKHLSAFANGININIEELREKVSGIWSK